MFRRLFAACACAVLGLSAAAAADPTPDELIRQYTESATTAAELLDAVKDAKSAANAKPKLDELATRQAEVKAVIEKLPQAVRLKMDEKALAQAEEKLSLAHDRVLAKERAAYKVLHGSKLFDAIEKPREAQAAASAKMLGTQTMAYSAKYMGKFPTSLKELVAPADKRTPLVDGGMKALFDPWGFPYQYELGKVAIGANKVEVDTTFVWTVSPYTGKKIGNPPPEKK
ncbi:MAG: hypothetical protein ABGY75_05675 [Gemmataceae bacterium]